MVSRTMSTFTHQKNGTILPEQPAEHSDFETESDGETEKEERTYDETLLYLEVCMADVLKVPQCRTKGVIRKRSKHYRARRATSYHASSYKAREIYSTAEIDLTGSASLCRDKWQKGHSVMELSGMPRKRHETTAELTDKFQCVRNRNILCINYIEPF